jgi:hypothetical protein
MLRIQRPRIQDPDFFHAFWVSGFSGTFQFFAKLKMYGGQYILSCCSDMFYQNRAVQCEDFRKDHL